MEAVEFTIEKAAAEDYQIFADVIQAEIGRGEYEMALYGGRAF